MKINKILLPIYIILLASCSNLNIGHEYQNNTESARQPAGFFDSCKQAMNGFFGKSDEKALRTEGKVAATIDRDYVVNNHKQNTFTTGRGLQHYKNAFNRAGFEKTLTFAQDLEKIKNNPNAHWLDAGGGLGFATEQATTESTKFKSTLISVETPAEEIIDSQTNEIRRHVIKGKFIEDIADEELIKSDIITDMYGPMAYSSHPDQVLRKYINNLKQTGVVYIHLGEDLDTFGIYNEVLSRDGKFYHFSEWLESIPGLKVEIVKVHGLLPDTTIVGGEKSRIAKITLLKKSTEIEITALQRVSYVEGSSLDGFIVPRMIFKETGPHSLPPMPKYTSVNNSLKKLVVNFRTGEYEHSLFDEIEKIESSQWAHFSNTEINWAVSENLTIKDESHFEISTNKIISRAKKLSKKNLIPAYSRPDSLGPTLNLKVISDHNGTFASYGSMDKMLKSYLDALDSKGKILLYLGDETTGISKAKILKPEGGYITFKKWISSIPGISVQFKRTKESVATKIKKIDMSGKNIEMNANGATILEDSTELENAEIVVIEIKDRAKISIPELNYLGRSSRDTQGFETPIYSLVN
jgi:hypothetical protein